MFFLPCKYLNIIINSTLNLFETIFFNVILDETTLVLLNADGR